MGLSDKSKFLIRNLTRGILWLMVIVGIFLFISSFADEIHYDKYLQPIYDQPFWVFLVFLVSEIIFGIIPPEIFMLWGVHLQDMGFYIFAVALFSIFSYGAGVIGFLFGSYMYKSGVYEFLRKHILKDYIKYLHKYGGFLVIVASLTPLPYSAISMLVGTVKFPFKKFLTYSLFRFARFAAYSFFIWHAYALA